MVRNTYDFDQTEKSNFWYIIKDSFGGLDELSSNVRRKIRKAKCNIDYKIIDEKTLRDVGYPIIKATFENYKVKDRDMNESIFNSYLDECCKYKFDFWGIFNKDSNELIGFCAVHVWDNSCEYGLTAIWPDYLSNATYPYYGLYYTMSEYYLDNLHFEYVSDSARSVTEHSNIQPFLEENFNFKKAYCKLKLTYKWWFGAIVRMLYPFRKLIPNRNVRAMLRMHGMQNKILINKHDTR